MDARKVTLWDLLDGNKKYRVPPYQRRYAWQKIDWDRLWEHVLIQYGAETDQSEERAPHFFGSVVLQPQPDMSAGISGAEIIDGQQRLVTTALLLMAMRDFATDEEEVQLTEECLLNLQRKGDERLKLQLGRYDHDDYVSIMDGEGHKVQGLLGAGYRWFLNEVERLQRRNPKQFNFSALRKVVTTRLEVVRIQADDTDNAHRIFQTLNSTGRSLTQSDLIRNHFFMVLGPLAEKAYEDHWAPMEDRLEDDLEPFFLHYLVAHGRHNTTRDTIYQNYQMTLTEIESKPDKVLAELKLISSHSKSYLKIIDPSQEKNALLRKALNRFQEWGTTHQRPLLLRAQILADAGKITKQQAAKACHYIESYLVRRLLAGLFTNNLNRNFSSVAGRLHKAEKDFTSKLLVELSRKAMDWPSDEDLSEEAESREFYWSQKRRQQRFILQALAESLAGKEIPDWEAAEYSIEHVLPQTLTDQWLEMLRKGGATDPHQVHYDLKDTLGNLTLTAHNPELSNHPLERKQQIFNDSGLKMNRTIAKTKSWGEKEIRKRSRDLYELACELWQAPQELEEDTSELFLSKLQTILEGLEGETWTTFEDLASVLSCEVLTLRQLVIDSEQLPNRDFILGEDGSVDVDLPWVAKGVGDFFDRMVSAGIVGPEKDKNAPKTKRLDLDQLLSSQGPV
mgnify:CR=1 FL=1|jgi:uncharacterized protein with ParB-like and HNH nuclease domain